MPPLRIQVETRPGGGTQVTVTGDLDAHCVRDMERTLEEVAASKPGKLVLDVSGLDYISSSGALCLLTSCRAMREEGTAVILVKPRCPIYEILDLLGMTQLLTFASTREEAWAALQ